MHAGAIDGAAKQFLEFDEAVTLVEIQAAEHFVLEVAQFRSEKIGRCARAPQGGSGLERLRELPARDFNCRLKLGEPGRTESGYGAEALPVGGDELTQRTKSLEHVARQIDGGVARRAG